MSALVGSRRIRLVAKTSIGLVLLAALVWMVDKDQLFTAVKDASGYLLVASFLAFAAQGLFESFRLKIIFKTYQLSFTHSARLFLVGLFFSNFMPGLVGADVYQIQQMHRLRPGLIRPLTLSLILRLSGLALNALLAVVTFALMKQTPLQQLSFSGDLGPPPRWVVVFASVLVSVAILTAVTKWGRGKLTDLARQVEKMLHEALGALRTISLRQQVAMITLGILVILARVASYYLLIIALGSYATLADVILAVTITAVVLVLPVSFAGLGVREVSLVAVLVSAGLDPATAVAASLISRGFIWLLSLFGGAWFLWSAPE